MYSSILVLIKGIVLFLLGIVCGIKLSHILSVAKESKVVRDGDVKVVDAKCLARDFYIFWGVSVVAVMVLWI